MKLRRLYTRGKRSTKDFILFDAFNPGTFQIEERYEINVGVDWLKAISLKSGGTIVSLR
ncbi:hypothetical protein ACFLR7_05070 [Acidobacteriota bacterium]